MLRGYRIALCAAFGWLILAAGPPTPNNREPNKNSEPKTESALNSIAASLNQANEPSPLEAPCPEGKDERRSDLCAQWKAADAAESGSNATWLFGGLGSLIGALTLAAAWSVAKWAKKAAEHTETGATEARRAANAAELAIDEAQRIGEAQVRAYLSVKSVVLHFHEGWFPAFIIEMANSGQSPARSVGVKVSVTYQTNGPETGREGGAQDFGKLRVDIPASSCETLMPMRMNSALTPDEIRAPGVLVTVIIQAYGNDVFDLPLVVSPVRFGGFAAKSTQLEGGGYILKKMHSV